MRVSSLVAPIVALAILATAIACGGSDATAPSAPTASPQPTLTPTAVPASAGVLDGRETRLWVIYGCECAGPPAAGLIDVQIFQPETVSDYTPLKWRVSHPSMAHPVEMPLIREMLSLHPCAPKDEPPPVLPADHAWYRIPYGELVPSGPGFEVSVLVRNRAGSEFWVQVEPTKVCSAVS